MQFLNESRTVLPNRETPFPNTSDVSPLPVDGHAGFVKGDTIPMMILKGVAKRGGQSEPVMQSEISGAAGNAAIIGVGSMAGSVLKYGTNLLIQRGFGAGTYGLYSISYSLVSLVAAVFNLGLDDAMVRYVSIYRVKGEINALRGLAIFCTAVAGLLGLIGAILLFLFAPILADIRKDPTITPILQVMCPLVPLLSMQIMWYGGLQGFKAFKFRVLAERIIFPLVMIQALIVFLLVMHTIIGVVLAMIIGIIASMLFSLYALLRQISRRAGTGQEKYEVREWLRFATPNLFTTIVDMTLESTDTLLLALFAIPNVQIGLYMAAIKLSGFIVMPQTSLNSMFAPTIAELHSQGEKEKLALMFRVVTKWAMTLSLPIFFVVTLFSIPLLAISGGSFTDAWPLLIAFALGNIINTSTGAVGYLLMMTGHQKISVFNSVSAVLINAVVGLILTPLPSPFGGAMGVAISTGLAVSVVNLMRLVQVRMLLKMYPYHWDTLKPIGAGVISTMWVGSVLYLLYVNHVNIFLCLLLIPVFLASYAGIIVLFKLSSEDQIVIDSLRKKLRFGKKRGGKKLR